MATNKKRKKKAEVMAEDGSMTLTGHLKELRNRLIICAVVFVVGVVVSLAYADRLIDLLTAMGREYYQFVSIAPQEKLMQYFRVSILAGVVVTVPVAFYNIYAFAKPGLKKSESAFFKLVMLLGLILFCVGVLFAYKLMMPFMLRFLSTGIEGAEYIQTTTSIESYVNLCLTMFIIFGCVFEMPLITSSFPRWASSTRRFSSRCAAWPSWSSSSSLLWSPRRTSCPSAWWLSPWCCCISSASS